MRTFDLCSESHTPCRGTGPSYSGQLKVNLGAKNPKAGYDMTKTTMIMTVMMTVMMTTTLLTVTGDQCSCLGFAGQ